ncbi:MAG: M1 family metallopeptidase [Candidatus Doudnabacteria bacterium]|nr:M1 family metallopeptidase [Candidatus Doudnabacteria bacterium]
MNKVLLSKYIKPERYKLSVKPSLENFVFEGKEMVYLELLKPVKEITLHAKDLKVTDVEFKIRNLKFQTVKIKYDTKAETVTFVFSKALLKGKGELSLKFKGVLNDFMRGFYRGSYTHEGKKRYLATTQFEATDARRAFPCFDEPALKAVFEVSIILPSGMTAISNTVETSVKEHGGGYKIVEFSPSPKMSTYLLAFIVGDFEHIEGKTKRGVTVRVFVTPGKRHQAKFALECGIKTLDFYEKYFDIKYPLPIMDMIAIPDFSHGAMENWGAVTYRESALLVDPENSSSANKQWVALVIAHELAHQWFGNLVTMHWWTDLWLNEGFASYIEYLAVDHLFPAWDIWTQFAYVDLGAALRLDGLKNTHPIEIEVKHPDEIGEIFDEVSYSKGASLIRMLADYLGEKNFRDGLRYYLKKHAYKNTRTTDLWDAFEAVSKRPVKSLMQNWTKKEGYPLLKVTERPKEIVLEQSRFYISQISKRSYGDKTLWQIPISIKSAGQKKVSKIILDTKSKIIPKPKGWVKFNTEEAGFFRTDYPAQMLKLLHPAIMQKKLSAVDRLGIIRDAFALAESQELPTAEALRLAESYKNETDFTVWTEISAGINSVYQLICGQPYEALYKKMASEVFKKQALLLGFRPKKGESHTAGLLRSLLLNNYGSFGGQEVVKKAKEIFSSGKVPADIRGVVYQLVAESGGKKEFQALLKKYKTESLNEEKNRIGRALANFKQPEIVRDVLDLCLSEHVRLQDAPLILASVMVNPHGREEGFKFLKKNWGELSRRYPSSGHMLARVIKPLGLFSSQKHLGLLKKFFKNKKSAGLGRAIEQVLEKCELNVLWLRNENIKIKNWLEKQVG